MLREAFHLLSLNVTGSLRPSSCSRGYMVWKMLVEEFQDGIIELDNLWYANGMISAIQAFHFDLVSAQEDIWFERRYCLKY